MPNVKELLESEYVTMDFLQSSPSKKATIISGGIVNPSPEGVNRLTLMVEIDSRHKKYTPNKTTLRVFVKAWGEDSDNWVGKVITLSTSKVNNKDAILGNPVLAVSST